MERKHQEYIERHLYEERLHREHAVARENRVAVERGDDDSETDLTPTKEQMYLDIIKELERKLAESEAKHQESVSQQSLDRLLEMLAAKDSSIERLTEELRLSREKSAAEIKSLRNEFSTFRAAMERLLASKDADLRHLNGQLFGKSSLKGRRSKSNKEQDNDQDRDNFDGTPESISNSSTDTSTDKSTEQDLPQSQELTGKVVKKPIRPEKYNTMKAAKVVHHLCDISLLPEGYKFIRYKFAKQFTHISYVQEDRYQIAVISNRAGNIKDFYIPLDKSDTSMPRENIVNGTHVTPEMLAFMVVNKYLMHTPINRQMLIFQNDKGQFSQQTVANYYTKAYEQMSVLKSYLESILKKAGSFIHCDETWVRVRVSDGSEVTDGETAKGIGATKLAKRYMWTIGGVASEKMYTAVNYMLNFWSELINYTNQGHYTIDNSAAERSIRPLTVGRKNYIHFGSEKSAEIAAFFYSIMATCKMRGTNARDYVAGFFKALNAGRTDYAQMLPGLL